MRIALGQIDSISDKAENLEKVRSMTAVAASQGADLVVFPEFTMFEHTALDRNFVDASEPLNGPFVEGLREIARENDIDLVAGVLERRSEDDRASNTTVVIDGSGDLQTVYRKVHLYDAFGARESDIIIPGTDLSPVTFDIDGLRVGIQTCYDLRFPELTRLLVDEGADLVLNVASWTPGVRKEDHWISLSRARAIENTIFFAAVSQAPPISTGGSALIDPMGIIVGELGEKAGISTYEIDPERVAKVRATNPCLVNRRYSVIPLAS